MKNQDRFLFLLFVAMLDPCVSHAQSRSALIIVHGAPSLDCIVKSVFPWGITTTEDISVMFRVVEMIKTSDESLCEEIHQVVKNLRTSKIGEQFVLDFQEAEIQKVSTKSFNPFRYDAVRMYVATSDVNQFGVQLDFTPWFSRFVLARFEGSVGFRDDHGPFANLNLGAGIGGCYEFDFYKTAVLLSFARYTGYAVTGRELVEERVFASTLISRRVGSQHEFQLSLGVDYYPVALNIYGIQSVATVLFGFGIML